jgi:hypothetical protein
LFGRLCQRYQLLIEGGPRLGLEDLGEFPVDSWVWELASGCDKEQGIAGSRELLVLALKALLQGRHRRAVTGVWG